MRYSRWESELVPGHGDEILSAIALWELAEVKDREVAEPIEEAILSQDWLALSKLTELDYCKLSVEDAGALRRVLALYTKRCDLRLPGVNPEEVAAKKFLDSEVLCKNSNEIFRLRRRGLYSFRPSVEGVLSHAARKISSILGEDYPPFELLKMKFGPGATTSIPKRMASPRAKLGSSLACSIELFSSTTALLREVPALAALNTADGEATPLVEIHSGKVQFVPKTWKEDRAIVVEPLLNTFVQSGVGTWMAQRLRKSGVDIRDQTRNRRAARKGSIDGSLATVDLSSASDTIATEVVYELLPLHFASWLARFRTGHVTLNGQALKLEKFSSMGNGFTFPLETLIFYALAYGSAIESGADKRAVSAYGDDIIIPSEAYPLLVEVLTACGFLINASKSYSTGPFRESCGADYVQGIDIRPCYLKGDEGSLHVYDLFRLHNFYHRRFDFDVCSFIRSFLDPSITLFGPDGYGDGHLLSDRWEPTYKTSHLGRGFSGCVFDTFTWKPRESFWPSRGDRILPAYSTYVGSNDATSVVRSYRGDAFSVTVPGRKSVNRISIYILNP